MAELVANQGKMSEMQSHIISGLANLIESRDTDTGEHVTRTSIYARAIAENARAEGLYTDEIDDDFIAMTVEEAVAEIKRESGSHFDPELTDVFLRYIQR